MMNWDTPKKMFVYEYKGRSAFETFAPLASRPYSLFFDSNRPSHPLSRYSYLCWHPFETIEAKNGRVTITNKENQFTYAADPFVVVRERLSLWGENIRHDKKLPAFQGGAAGFFGYDLGRWLEKIRPVAKDDKNMPDMCIGLYDKVLAFDHQNDCAYLIVHAVDEKSALVHKHYLDELESAAPVYHGEEMAWKTQRSDEQFKGDIARVIDYIYAGDIFQANLSRIFTATLPAGFDAYAHYGQLRNINAAPFSVFMNFGNVTLASSSPERFLRVDGRQIETRPIKGTLSSSLPAAELLNSEKDRAENAMIVDLMRNDLSKVCEDHSIDVTKLFDIETFEGLHHMVSTVKGVLRGDQCAIDALRACFPGGSITGAPKIRAMEIIEEMEPDRRGPYCGAMGWAGFDGGMDTSIAIRTLVYSGDTVSLQTGGGIVADSIPESELQETLTKAAKIRESFIPLSLREARHSEATTGSEAIQPSATQDKPQTGLLRSARNDGGGNG